MYDYILEEMADAISKELRVDNADVLNILGRYWKDKIAHVWQVEDVFESARRAGKPITREDAVEVLQEVFDHLDSDLGITWMTLDIALEDYKIDFRSLPLDHHPNVHGCSRSGAKTIQASSSSALTPRMRMAICQKRWLLQKSWRRKT
jgi:hypothetical protein